MTAQKPCLLHHYPESAVEEVEEVVELHPLLLPRLTDAGASPAAA